MKKIFTRMLKLGARVALAVGLISGLATGQSEPLLRNNTSAVHGVPQSGDAAPASVSKMDIHSMLRNGSETRVLVRYMPWWGEPKHIDVGYREDDAAQVGRQVADMASRGIDGAIVAWYGAKDRYKDAVAHRLLRAAERQGHFEVGVSIDIGSMKECVKGGCDATTELISLIGYVAREFWSSPAYLKYQGRPVLTSFGLEKLAIDWNRVKQNAPGNPILLFRNSGGFDKPASDGAFAWIAPETANDRDPMGTEYLHRFYKAAMAHKGAVVMGSAYSGFNDAAASWGKGRKIDQGCGRTWLETFALANEYLEHGGTLPFLIVPTWNDYEEGTEIESGIDNCVTLEARAEGSKLHWKVHGDERTIAQFLVYSGNAEVARLPRGTHAWTMTGEGPFTVVAQGVASVRNQMAVTEVHGTEERR
jgi:hypothetical protein